VTHFGTSRVTPEGAKTRNPAFDVTPHRYIAGIITEIGILRPPYTNALKEALARIVSA
jgi:methylthioribose-1-phosphate isomerase